MTSMSVIAPTRFEKSENDSARTCESVGPSANDGDNADELSTRFLLLNRFVGGDLDGLLDLEGSTNEPDIQQTKMDYERVLNFIKQSKKPVSDFEIAQALGVSIEEVRTVNISSLDSTCQM